MPLRVIRTVQRLSAAHARTNDLWSGRMRVGELVDTQAVWSKQHFPKLLAAILLTSGAAGNCFMGYLRQQDQEFRRQQREKNWLEARMQAMPMQFTGQQDGYCT